MNCIALCLFLLIIPGGNPTIPDSISRVTLQEKTSFAAALEKEIANGGNDAGTAFVLANKSNRDTYVIDEKELNRLAYKLLRERRSHEAEIVFRLNVELFPDSWNAWDSLGFLFTVTNRPEEGRKAYTRSLELNPGNANATRMLAMANVGELDRNNETKQARTFKPGEQTGLTGPFLGQKPPGLKGEPFAPGIVSAADHFDFGCTFTPDGKEFYFTTRRDPGGTNVIMVCRWTESGWTAPETAPFSGKWMDFEPHITPDGSYLYYGSRRPLPGSETENSEVPIWVMQRVGDGWSNATVHGQGMYVSTSRDGRIYLTDISGPAHGIVSYLGAAPKPSELAPEGGGVNTPGPGVHPCIAPDGSFIIFDSIRADGVGGPIASDLYVCFRQPDGSWGAAVNLGPEINTPGENICASFSPDMKYLFYTACKDIYWVSMDAVLKLRPGN